ncbi:MAG: SIR2 family protein [Gammaproteobacteria bacterium]|nr:SIR2 family protein [Gammaproteobacteria bacterium]MYF27528.1 SIR2 family protein [Gammaproteobacteria bacterium]
MWLLGAGASNAAGLPTANDLVVEFKRMLYVSQSGRGVRPDDLAEPAIRHRIEAHVESLGLPGSGDPDEYAAFFEAAFPDGADRAMFIDGQLSGAKPSYGHMALASLMSAGLCRLVWTTNFDTLVADACAAVFGTTSSLTTATLDAPELAHHAIAGGRWPLEVKLHGDFRSHRLKNTGDELRRQDTELRRMLIDCAAHFGLVVAGYSGRDGSVMNALEEALERAKPFPAGLFWLQRDGDSPATRVKELLERAVEAGVDAALVEIENFDEALRGLVNLCDEVDKELLGRFTLDRRYWSPAPLSPGRGSWPVVRLNALPLLGSPTHCRRVDCEIGGTAEVREAAADSSVIAVRSRVGVLAFGSDAEVRRAFEPYNVKEFDLHALDPGSRMERGLLHDALRAALIRSRGLAAVPDNRWALVPARSLDTCWKPLRKLVKTLSGELGEDGEIQWHEGISTRLEWSGNRLWLVFSPRTVFQGVTDNNKAVATDFSRERTVRRYNRELNDLLDFWSRYLDETQDNLQALGIGDGVDAAFRIGSTTAFSRRAYR